MSQATELLDNLTEEEISMYTADPSTEPHIIIGQDRFITVPAALKKIAIQHDHNVETVTFDCPRYWDGHDMSQWNVHINYALSNGYEDSYLADNVVVDDTDDTIMHFTWTISRNVTQVKGAITILICIKETDESGNEIHHWNTERNSDLTVSQGMECTEQVVKENSDVVDQLLTRMTNLEKKFGNPVEVDSAEEMDAILASATAADVGKLYLYTGETTEAYTNGAIYLIEEANE